MTYKVIKSNKHINPYGGINFVISAFKRKGIGELIDNHLGGRSNRATYSYSDVILGVIYSQLCGADRLNDMEYLKEQYEGVPGLKFPSPDTVEYVCEQLKTDTQIVISNNNIKHEFNDNQLLNTLLLNISIKTGQLNKNGSYTLDYDNVICENEKYDSKKTYKHTQGYQPGVAFIDKLPVHIQGRNGNSPAKYKMKETLEMVFNNLSVCGIKIKNFRSDCAAYQKEVIELVDKQCNHFYIRMMDCMEFSQQIREQEEWERVEINGIEYELCSLEYSPFGKDKSYRIVISREKRTDGQADLYTRGAYIYRGIITDNRELSNKEVVEFYNQRGTIEKNFDVLNNDFNWSNLPFSFLDKNTVFMLISAIGSVLFEYIKLEFSKKVDFVDRKMRIKRFLLQFMIVASQWIERARQYVLRLFTQKQYDVLLE